MAKEKYEFTGKSITYHDLGKEVILFQIRALIDIPRHNVHKGDIGGYIENDFNLSHKGKAWVADEAKVFHASVVSGDAYVSGDSIVAYSTVQGKVKIYGSAVIRHSMVKGYFYMEGNVEVNASYLNLRNSEVYGTDYSPYLLGITLKDRGLLIDDYGICVQPLSFRWASQLDWLKHSLSMN